MEVDVRQKSRRLIRPIVTRPALSPLPETGQKESFAWAFGLPNVYRRSSVLVGLIVKMTLPRPRPTTPPHPESTVLVQGQLVQAEPLRERLLASNISNSVYKRWLRLAHRGPQPRGCRCVAARRVGHPAPKDSMCRLALLWDVIREESSKMRV